MPDQARPRIYVLAPVHNRRAVTEQFVRRLLAQTYGNWHLVLIDDGSTDGTEAMVRHNVPDRQLTVLSGKGHWWWGGSLHQAYLWLKRQPAHPGDLVVTMNDDTDFDADFFANAVAAMQPRALLIAQARRKDHSLDEVGVSWDWRKLRVQGVTDIGAVNCCSTRGLFMHRDDFLLVGGFHPRLLPHYLSDYEFSIRAHRRGLKFVTSPNVFVRFDDDPQLTGLRSTAGYSPLSSLRANLSVRSAANPLHWTSFILLACPPRYVPVNILRVWWRYLLPLRRRG